MPKSKPSWTDKLHNSKPPKLKVLTKAFADMPEGSRMVVTSPAILDQYIQTLSPGQSVTLKSLRSDLADRHQAEHTCPVSSGIFLRIVAEAAWEKHLAGVPLENITPFWRAIDPDSPLTGKLACGPDFIRQQRSMEASLNHN